MFREEQFKKLDKNERVLNPTRLKRFEINSSMD